MIRRAVDIVRDAIEGGRWIFGTKEYCVVVTLERENEHSDSKCWNLMRQV